MTIFGIDTSGATVDWPKVKAAGISFAIVKATEGNGFVQSTLPANLKGMRALGSGFVPGAYHFLVSEKYVSGADQCDYFLSKVGDVSDMIVALDVEVEKNLTYQPGLVAIQQFVERFWHRVPGHPIIIYSGRWYWGSRSYMGNPNGTYLTKLLWDSKYITSPAHVAPSKIYPSVPAPWWTPGYGGWASSTLLQFTAMPSVPGVSGAVDASAFRGTLDQLKQQLVGGSVLPDTGTEPDVVITITKRTYYANRTLICNPNTTVHGYAPDQSTPKASVSIGPNGSSLQAVAEGYIDPPPVNTGTDYAKFYLLGGQPDGKTLAGCWVPWAEVTAKDEPLPPADCSAQTDPLNAQIATLQGKIDAAKTALG